MKNILLISLLILCSCASAFKPNQMELDQVTADGMFLYEYDRACWVATDSLLAQNPERYAMGSFFARKFESKWEVVFGRISEDSTCYLIAYKVIIDEEKNVEVNKLFPREKDTDFYFTAAKALQKAFQVTTVPIIQRRYNYYVQHKPDSILRIYFIPANSQSGVYLLGDDEFIDFDESSLKIVRQQRMHKSLLSFDAGAEKMASSFSTAILTNIPTPSDVFFVLNKESRVQHVVVTEKYYYFINIHGKIMYVTPKAMKSLQKK